MNLVRKPLVIAVSSPQSKDLLGWKNTTVYIDFDVINNSKFNFKKLSKFSSLTIVYVSFQISGGQTT